MQKSSRKASGNFESKTLPEPHGPLVGADHKIELHGPESAGLSAFERMSAHGARHAPAGGARGSDVTAISHVRSSALLISMQKVRADYFIVFFSDEYFVRRGEPVSKGFRTGHIARQSICFTVTDDGFEDLPDGVRIGRARGPDGYHGTNIALMTNLEFTPLVFLISMAGGYLGALTGLGGGVVVTPALTLLLGVDIRYAIGASLVSVIATSSGAAAAYVREGYSNIRIGMFLEIATTFGALFGAFISSRTPTSVLSIIFGLVLLHACLAIQPRAFREPGEQPRGSISDAAQAQRQLSRRCGPRAV